MLIDWFTVIAQLVNFVILLVALKYLLYDRILNAMDRRRERIEGKIDEAEAKEEEAENKAEELRKERADLEERRDELLEEAQERAREREQELLEEARNRIEEKEERWRQSLGEEQQTLLEQLERSTLEAATLVSRRALEDLADRELEAAVVDKFILLIDEYRPQIEEALAGAPDAVLTSGFDLSDSQRNDLRKAIGDTTDGELEIDWETDGDLGAGVSLIAGDHEISWDFADYLADVEDRLRERIASEGKREENAADGDDATSEEQGEGKQEPDQPDEHGEGSDSEQEQHDPEAEVKAS